jgi:hypothetical protein
VITAAGDEITGDAVILATGHSARDIYRLLAAKNILLEPKPFAVGFRIEHPQPFIDRVQYHLVRASRGRACCPPRATGWPPRSAIAACIRSACAPAAGSCPPPPRTTRWSSMA